jgi:hypothetical protein
MLVLCVLYPFLNVGRHYNRWNANPEPVKSEARRRRAALVRDNCSWWRYMIEESAVFVMEHKKETMLPDIFVATNGLINVGDEMFSKPNVMGRMLIVSARCGESDG